MACVDPGGKIRGGLAVGRRLLRASDAVANKDHAHSCPTQGGVGKVVLLAGGPRQQGDHLGHGGGTPQLAPRADTQTAHTFAVSGITKQRGPGGGRQHQGGAEQEEG